MKVFLNGVEVAPSEVTVLGEGQYGCMRREGDTEYWAAVTLHPDVDASLPLVQHVTFDAWVARVESDPLASEPERRTLKAELIAGDDTLPVLIEADLWPGCGSDASSGLPHRALFTSDEAKGSSDPRAQFLTWYCSRGNDGGLARSLPLEEWGLVRSKLQEHLAKRDWREHTLRTGAQGSKRMTFFEEELAVAWWLGLDVSEHVEGCRRWVSDQLYYRGIHMLDVPEGVAYNGWPNDRKTSTGAQITAYDAQHFEADRVALRWALTGCPVAGYHARALHRVWTHYLDAGKLTHEVNARALGWMLRGGAVLSKALNLLDIGKNTLVHALSQREVVGHAPGSQPYPYVTINTRAQAKAADHDFMGQSPWMTATCVVGALDWISLGVEVFTTEIADVGTSQILLAYLLSEDPELDTSTVDDTIPDDFDIEAWSGSLDVDSKEPEWPELSPIVVHHHTNDYGSYATHGLVRYALMRSLGHQPYAVNRVTSWAAGNNIFKPTDKNADLPLIVRMAPHMGVRTS